MPAKAWKRIQLGSQIGVVCRHSLQRTMISLQPCKIAQTALRRATAVSNWPCVHSIVSYRAAYSCTALSYSRELRRGKRRTASIHALFVKLRLFDTNRPITVCLDAKQMEPRGGNPNGLTSVEAADPIDQQGDPALLIAVQPHDEVRCPVVLHVEDGQPVCQTLERGAILSLTGKRLWRS